MPYTIAMLHSPKFASSFYVLLIKFSNIDNDILEDIAIYLINTLLENLLQYKFFKIILHKHQ